MKKTIRYFIRTKGLHGHFAANCLTYGPKQCLAHIAQLRKHRYDGRKPYALAEFEIVREVTVETIVGRSRVKK